jgi:hypothetical protein
VPGHLRCCPSLPEKGLTAVAIPAAEPSVGRTELPATRACRALEESISGQWAQYGSVRVEYLPVEISRLKTVTSRTTPQRIEFASSVLESIAGRGMMPYLPSTYHDEVGRERVNFGPLVEIHGDVLFVIDGVHRSLVAHRAGLASIVAAVIKPEHSPPPPGVLYDLLDIEIVRTQAPRLPWFPGRRSVHFRPSAMFAAQAEHWLSRKTACH